MTQPAHSEPFSVSPFQTTFLWPDTPEFDGTGFVNIVSTEMITSVRVQTEAADPPKAKLGRSIIQLGRREPLAAFPSFVHLPVTDLWGTTLFLVKTGEVGPKPVPLCHRAGSTLWITSTRSFISGRHVTEALDSNRWYLIGSHTSSELLWWDVAEWGGSTAVTLHVPRSNFTDDRGIVVVSTDGVAIERAHLYERTFAHEDTLAYSESRELPHEPTSEWKFDPRQVILDPETGRATVADLHGRNPSANLWGFTEAVRSAGAPPRSRKSALASQPNSESRPAGSLLTGSRSAAFIRATQGRPGATSEETHIVSVRTESKLRFTTDLASPSATDRNESPMISLMNTPYPNDDPGTGY
jgi:hypothetical protein